MMARHLATTNWSLILRAGATAPDVRQEAMAELCEAYWGPLYAFARARGATPDDAADLTQGFFLHLIDKHGLRGLDPDVVRFRAYLLGAFKHFSSDERDRATALKRGGGQMRVTFDPELLERRYLGRAGGHDDPEALFQHQWALTVIARARNRVRLAYEAAGKARDYEVLARHDATPAAPVRELAQALGVNEGAARVALFRLRRRLGVELRAEVAATVVDPHQVEAELRFLLAALAGPERGAVEA
jgi:RNA polymerase sigma factor (sigma-70 family)